METLHKYKWKLAWCCFAILIGVFCVAMYYHHDKPWFGNFVSAFGVLLTVYPTLLIFVQSRADSEKSMREQLDHLQKLSQAEIEVNRSLNEKQIDKIDASTKEQITEFKKSIGEQIKAFEESTNKQIQNYVTQTSEIVKRLEDNSILLAEILVRQLEEDITIINNKLDDANKKFEDRSKWKFLRSREDKQAELSKWKRYINSLEQKLNYLKDKWKQVKTFLGGE